MSRPGETISGNRSLHKLGDQGSVFRGRQYPPADCSQRPVAMNQPVRLLVVVNEVLKLTASRKTVFMTDRVNKITSREIPIKVFYR